MRAYRRSGLLEARCAVPIPRWSWCRSRSPPDLRIAKLWQAPHLVWSPSLYCTAPRPFVRMQRQAHPGVPGELSKAPTRAPALRYASHTSSTLVDF
jgi:hypothetical protein